MASFLNHEKALLTVMLQCREPGVAVGRIRNALHSGAEAFGLQTESLARQYQNEEVYRRLLKEMAGKPVYVTAYDTAENKGRPDEELAQELLTLADCGATLCDVMGDLFDERQPDEMAVDPAAIEKQEELIRQLHDRGAEVLMSSHVLKFTPAERVLEIAREQRRRGADIIKIVTGAADMAQQAENLRIADLLRRETDAPFLFLSGGQSTILRRVGWKLGCCMILCVYEHDERSTVSQPLLRAARAARDDLGF